MRRNVPAPGERMKHLPPTFVSTLKPLRAPNNLSELVRNNYSFLIVNFLPRIAFRSAKQIEGTDRSIDAVECTAHALVLVVLVVVLRKKFERTD